LAREKRKKNKALHHSPWCRVSLLQEINTIPGSKERRVLCLPWNEEHWTSSEILSWKEGVWDAKTKEAWAAARVDIDFHLEWGRLFPSLHHFLWMMSASLFQASAQRTTERIDHSERLSE
jgi:hypothetical protein